ncbi:MAG TPA: sigma-70 family RNA polymerase sigma factor [Candidatus Glassbacteria bacterium]|jgi:RNA polymerase primary sigma factor|nr:sigma-70 family RNA polymerase sigma factor [Candidatus Glassbacteria bacterium]
MKEKSSIPINQEEIAEYLKDIRRIRVMTPERERILAQKMLSPEVTEQEKKMVQKELLEGNLRFVITVSKQYQNQGLDLSDLIAEGNYGLMKAIENFDWSKGLRFISYAVWWVRQSILQSLNENARTIRLPVNVVQELHRAKKELDNKGVELPDKFTTLPYTINLDNPLNEEGDTLIDVLNNPNAELADAGLSTEDTLKKKLIEMLDILDNRERVIIEDYFGLSGNNRTLEDIGGDFSLTKERVRQIKEKALRKLRNETAGLFDYI